MLTMGCLQLGASLINLPALRPNLAYYYPQPGDTGIYCTRRQIQLKLTPQEAPYEYLRYGRLHKCVILCWNKMHSFSTVM